MVASTIAGCNWPSCIWFQRHSEVLSTGASGAVSPATAVKGMQSSSLLKFLVLGHVVKQRLYPLVIDALRGQKHL